ncbi:MAG TPA: porin, partial [Thermoanaerobaculia bacterium]
SGEMGNKAVTRLDYGPKGETVMFESGDAIVAYNAKYQKTEAPPKDIKADDVKLPFNVQYRMPGLRLSFPKAEINLSNRLQVRFTDEQFDEIVAPPTPFPSTLEDRGSFRIRRMKTKFDGWIYSKDLTYELQLNWPDSANVLEDANLDYDFTNGKKLFRIKAGQFKAPFSQQQLTSSGNQQFVDRSLLDGQFVPGRQIGVQAWGQFGGTSVPDFIDWRLGIFNGNGRTVSANDNDQYEYTARVMVSPFGSVGYSESNLEGYDFRLSVAGEYNKNDQAVQGATGAPTGNNDLTYGASVVLKAFKSLFAYLEYYDGSRRTPAGIKTDRDGWVGQVGWLFDKFEIAGRYAEYDPNSNATAANDQKEWRIGGSWYINRHNWKIQADYGVTENEAAAASTNRELKELRVQAQLIF